MLLPARVQLLQPLDSQAEEWLGPVSDESSSAEFVGDDLHIFVTPSDRIAGLGVPGNGPCGQAEYLMGEICINL